MNTSEVANSAPPGVPIFPDHHLEPLEPDEQHHQQSQKHSNLHHNNEKNPWDVEKLEEFMYFCCPECDERNRSKEIFLQHAFDQHPKAKEYLQKFQIKEELLEEGEMKNDITEDYISVNCEPSDFHSFSGKN